MVGGGKQGAQTGTQAVNGILIYIVWNLWKERNRTIFENAHMTAQQVTSLAKEDIMQRHKAMTFAG